MQKGRREPKLRRLRRPQTAFPRLRRIGVLGDDFLWELNHQLHIRNDPQAHCRAGHLWMLDTQSDAYSEADRRIDAHVEAVLKMYGAPDDIDLIPGSDVVPSNYDSAAWRRVARDMLIDVLDIDPRYFDADALLDSFNSSCVFDDYPDLSSEPSARHLARVIVNTQYPGLIRSSRTGRPNRWHPVKLSLLLMDHENGKVVERRRLHEAQNAALNPLAPYVLMQHEDKLLCEAVRDTVRIIGQRVRKRNS
jgi:hypothetical protein